MSDFSSRYDHLPSLREVIADNDLRADKKLGQNFLFDLNITDKIVRDSGGVAGDIVVEIGPGPGGLTRSILKGGAQKVIAIEYDPRAVKALQPVVEASDGQLVVLERDALKTDLRFLIEDGHVPAGERLRIFGNLPYNIATVLLTNWCALHAEKPDFIRDMTLMFQKEVADRFTASPREKTYGRLSVMLQWVADCYHLFDLPPSVFVPPPQITSSVVQICPKADHPDLAHYKDMEKIVAAAFGQRRKMLRSSLKPYADALAKSGIAETARAEELTPDDFLTITKAV